MSVTSAPRARTPKAIRSASQTNLRCIVADKLPADDHARGNTSITKAKKARPPSSAGT